MKAVQKVKVEYPERFRGERKMTGAVLEQAMRDALKKIDQLHEDMQGDFPDAFSVNGKYGRMKNVDGWESGFWCGMQWLAYEVTGDVKYKEWVESLLETFNVRIEQKLGVNHHDMGFIYVPSCVAAYKLTGNERAKEAALMAADHLMTRYHEAGGYIQAWGNVGEMRCLIVDCMNNIPLLYWASEVTGDSKYHKAAEAHARTTLEYIIREDGSSYHSYFFEADGTPVRGVTHQGAADESCWARGQSWLVSGLPLTYKYVKDENFFPLFESVTNYFLNHLPEDYVPYWDLSFNDGSGEERDSSAGAIAACGILQMLPLIPDGTPEKEFYIAAVDKIMYSLYENYSTKDTPESNGLLLHAVYTKPRNIGVDACNIWGCYYYMEALARMYKGLEAYW